MLRRPSLRLLCASIYFIWSAPLIALCWAPSILHLLLGLPSLILAVVCAMPVVDYLRFGVDRDGSRVIEDVRTKGCWTWNVVGTLLSFALSEPMESLAGLTLWPCLFIDGQVEMKKKRGKVVVDDTTAHERIHLAQAAECGVLPFYALYVGESLARVLLGDGVDHYYMRLSFEREAYLHEDEPAYLQIRHPFAWWPLLMEPAEEEAAPPAPVLLATLLAIPILFLCAGPPLVATALAVLGFQLLQRLRAAAACAAAWATKTAAKEPTPARRGPAAKGRRRGARSPSPSSRSPKQISSTLRTS